MKRVYIQRENLVGTNTFCNHSRDRFCNYKCDETCDEFQRRLDQTDRNNRKLQPLNINNSWVRNVHQYKTKAGGAISQINQDQVIAVCSEAFAIRTAPKKTYIPKEQPIDLDYKYSVVDRKTCFRTQMTRTLYKRKTKKLDTRLTTRQKKRLSSEIS
ncbi:unnamed protein product [Moneuplotes crassus]|uniref:Uncharacterized protein n=1 Tax=Euplotes crassus TaxID=5936 RepID=A0AAD1XG85_EUPCR|nr:unnamed protein product [Moneuplotes crassus]